MLLGTLPNRAERASSNKNSSTRGQQTRRMTEAQLYIPDQLLKDAAQHGELVVFVGAGASMLCGSPDWRGFVNQVVGALEKGGVLSFLEAQQLRGLGDSRRTLSIAMALAKEKSVAIEFDSVLHPTKPAAIGSELYELLSNLRPVFVTTNYDKWLDDAGPVEPAIRTSSGLGYWNWILCRIQISRVPKFPRWTTAWSVAS